MRLCGTWVRHCSLLFSLFSALFALRLYKLVYFGVPLMTTGSIGVGGVTGVYGAVRQKPLRVNERGMSSYDIHKRRRNQADMEVDCLERG